MARILISNLKDHIDKSISISGRVLNVRKLSNVNFVIVQDRTGLVQAVFDKQVETEPNELVKITGTIKVEERARGGFEIVGQKIETLAKNYEPLPFDITKPELKLQLNNLLDYRTLSLRHPKIQAVFKLYDLLLKSYETVMRQEGFVEVKTPKLLGAASEGGANFFQVQYFNKHAYLAQSPQFYKQIMVGVYERVFEIGSTFRAEPHFTTRHVNEYISFDAEMGFIDSFRDVTAMLTKVLTEMFEIIKDEGTEYLKLYNAVVPEIPAEIPHISLDEIKKIIREKYKYEIPNDTDLDPEGERLAGRYAKEEFDSDFIFITHYYWHDKPFYHLPSPGQKTTEGFDLLFRGMELVTGSQRIHEYDILIQNMKKKGVSSKGMEFYLDVFKYAMPPHGGWGMGSERLIQQLLGLGSVKEAVLFPRDVKRLEP